MNPTQPWQVFRFLAILFLAGGFCSMPAGADDNSPDWPVIAEQSARQLEKNPGDDNTWAKLVEARIMTSGLKRAEKTLADWRAQVPHPSAQIEKLEAQLAVAREDSKGAIKAWKRYLELEPKDSDAWRNVAVLYADGKDWRSAIDSISHPLEQKPDAGDFATRAHYRIRLHDWTKA